MDKKEIYEHLAKIYLDASAKKKKKIKTFPKFFTHIIVVVVVIVFASSLFSLKFFLKKKPNKTEIALIVLPEATKINFHFNPAKKEVLNISLNKLNLSRYNSLVFSVKNTNYRDKISLRVEFSNSFKEKSEIYFKEIPHKWQEYRINLAQFKGVNDWTEMSDLSFCVEEWNVLEKKGVVFIDNVRFVK
ncbi:MAG: hypothetical protein PHO70_00795 [Candidatus Omnitrophica bacterium]|nr:hypothetical protein [Candidatus Omnitrophota bacterium]